MNLISIDYLYGKSLVEYSGFRTSSNVSKNYIPTPYMLKSEINIRPPGGKGARLLELLYPGFTLRASASVLSHTGELYLGHGPDTAGIALSEFTFVGAVPFDLSVFNGQADTDVFCPNIRVVPGADTFADPGEDQSGWIGLAYNLAGFILRFYTKNEDGTYDYFAEAMVRNATKHGGEFNPLIGGQDADPVVGEYVSSDGSTESDNLGARVRASMYPEVSTVIVSKYGVWNAPTGEFKFVSKYVVDSYFGLEASEADKKVLVGPAYVDALAEREKSGEWPTEYKHYSSVS